MLRGMSPSKNRNGARDLRGAGRLAIDATTRVTGIVEEMHHTIGGFPARLFSAPVYAIIRGITKVAGKSLDLALERLEGVVGEGAPGAERDALVAALNGIVGDHLQATQNPLAITMRLRHDGAPRPRVVVLIHGSSMSDRQWRREGHDHGEALARDLDASAIYATYNSGLHVEDNGRQLAVLLEEALAAWPVPVESIVLLGHSMGGLVARSAIAHAEKLSWRKQLRALVTLGTPHHGAPLERIGHLVQLLGGVSRYSAPIAKAGNLRSAGVMDLRHGLALPLPTDVACFALAATSTKSAGARRLAGDGLVPVVSSHGEFPEANRAIAYGVTHLGLLCANVYPTILAWLTTI